uniref:Uncharacterized protein n=1 Tax=Sphaerodactylus townsendi TaxID=933632 RepID=A0ACB8FEM6_9SAUR
MAGSCKRIALFGATGMTGSATLAQALEAAQEGSGRDLNRESLSGLAALPAGRRPRPPTPLPLLAALSSRPEGAQDCLSLTVDIIENLMCKLTLL